MTVICDAPAPTGRRVTPGSWNRDDVIVIPSPNSTTIARVCGRRRHAIRRHDTRRRRRRNPAWLSVLPSRWPAFSVCRLQRPRPTRLCTSVRSTGRPPVRLMDTESNGQYANGSLLFVRGTTLMAQPFDPATLALTGDAVVVAERRDHELHLHARRSVLRVRDRRARLPGVRKHGNGAPRVVGSCRQPDGRHRRAACSTETWRLSPDGMRASVSLANARDSTE